MLRLEVCVVDSLFRSYQEYSLTHTHMRIICLLALSFNARIFVSFDTEKIAGTSTKRDSHEPGSVSLSPGQCLHFECRGAPARVRAWRCEGRPPLPHHFVCVEKSTLPYLTSLSVGTLSTGRREGERLDVIRPCDPGAERRARGES